MKLENCNGNFEEMAVKIPHLIFEGEYCVFMCFVCGDITENTDSRRCAKCSGLQFCIHHVNNTPGRYAVVEKVLELQDSDEARREVVQGWRNPMNPKQDSKSTGGS